MCRFSHWACLGFAVSALGACGKAPAPAAPAKPVVPQEELARVVERYWDERIAVEDAISVQTLADSLDVERRYLAQLEALPRERLDAAARLNFDLFKRGREANIEGFTYPGELIPLNPFGGLAVRLALEAAEIAQHPLSSAADYDRWLKRIDAGAAWSQQAIANMRQGVRRGYTSPRSVVLRTLPLLERLGSEGSSNVFYAPLRSLPVSMAPGERTRLAQALNEAVATRLLPAIRALHEFVAREYLPRARQSVSMSDLPLGSSWYAYRVKRAIGSAYSPADVHRLGLAEVERLRPRLAAETSSAPTPGQPSSDLPGAYEQLRAGAAAHLGAEFSSLPDAPLVILATDIAREPATPLSYAPAAADDERPAVLYLDTSMRGARPAIASFLEHALPGMHLQDSLQRAANLPRFRRFNVEPAFVEGWGLYAATLGAELGLYTDEAANAQLAALEMRCAAALVVDTGLHAQGWTRAQALDYLHAKLNLDDGQAQALVDGYAAMPADALACSMGELKIRALRSRTQQALGSRFDIREFHMQILKDGAMPLDILEAKIAAWTESLR
jgi:uncharacterized protein (DUF885 family)